VATSSETFRIFKTLFCDTGNATNVPHGDDDHHAAGTFTPV